MKFCPKCGEMLDDSANVCPRCGAMQGSVSNTDSSSKYKNTPSAPTGSSSAVVTSDNDVDPSVYNDPAFPKLFKVYKIKSLFHLSMLLCVVIGLLMLFLPVFTFTGKEVGDTSLVSSYPFTSNLIDLLAKYNPMKSKVETTYFGIGPDEITNIPPICLTVGGMLPIVMGVIGCLLSIPSKKYVGKLIQTSGVESAKKVLSKDFLVAIFGGAGSLSGLVGFIIMKAQFKKLSYSYPDAKRYMLGEIMETPFVVTFGIIICAVSLVLLIVGNVLFSELYLKKALRE